MSQSRNNHTDSRILQFADLSRIDPVIGYNYVDFVERADNMP